MKVLFLGSLDAHCQTQNGFSKGGPGQEVDGEVRGNDPRTNRMLFPTMVGPRHFPVEGCSGRAATRTSIRVHLFNWHVRETMVILEEGNLVVEVLGVNSSVTFELYLDEEFMEFWWYHIMFQNPYATNSSRLSNVQWWRPPISWNHSGRFLRLL